MAEFRLNERSDAELYEIFLYGFLQFGERQADRYYAELKRIFQLIADNPGWVAKRSGSAQAFAATSTALTSSSTRKATTA